MAKRSAKSFKAAIDTTLQSGLDDILNGIPIAGDDILADLMDATSDRTAQDTPLADAAMAASEEIATEAPLPEDLGEETGVSGEYVERVEAIRQQSGGSLEEAEALAGRESNSGPAAEQSAPTEPMSEQEAELNAVALEEVVEWYDMLQSLLATWAFDHFCTPANAARTMEELYPKVSSGQASASERTLYERAQETVLGFTRRKSSFAEQVAMSAPLKGRIVRMLDKILQIRQINLSPEWVLGLMIASPLIINGGRIVLEKFGFGNVDELAHKFNILVSDQEKAFWQQS